MIGRFIASLALVVLQGVLPLLALYLMKLIVDAVTFAIGAPDKTAAIKQVVLYIALAAAVALLNALLEMATNLVRETQTMKVSDHMYDVLHGKSIEVDLTFYENPTYYDTLHRAQQEGCEIDLDAYLRYTSDRAAGQVAAADGLYRDLRIGARDLACLLLADLSLSTDSWVNNRDRVIDVIRDSLYLFAESLGATGDSFAMYGFSSRKRDPIRFHQLKTFDEQYTGTIRGRIAAIKPGYYTRMGAAIRHSTELLKLQSSERRLLLILTDGKPNDLDKYEGRYGIEDTRQAIHEARQAGLQPFCVTIDTRANDYLPHLFGTGSYVVIHKPTQLPKELPLLYARLTA